MHRRSPIDHAPQETHSVSRPHPCADAGAHRPCTIRNPFGLASPAPEELRAGPLYNRASSPSTGVQPHLPRRVEPLRRELRREGRQRRQLRPLGLGAERMDGGARVRACSLACGFRSRLSNSGVWVSFLGLLGAAQNPGLEPPSPPTNPRRARRDADARSRAPSPIPPSPRATAARSAGSSGSAASSRGAVRRTTRARSAAGSAARARRAAGAAT